MAEKQLNILVKARDDATGVLKQVGDSTGTLGERLKALEESGHGLHSELRNLKAGFTGFELAVVDAKLVTGAFSVVLDTFRGDTAGAAEAQRGMYNALAEIPLVGKQVSEAAEAAGTAIAHAFGKESTKEIEEETKKKEAILKEFAEFTKHFMDDATKLHKEAEESGLDPTQKAIQKAKDDFATRKAEIDKEKSLYLQSDEANSTEPGAVQHSAAVRAALSQALVDAQKLENDEIAKATNAQLAEIAKDNREAAKQLEERLEANKKAHDKELAEGARFNKEQKEQGDRAAAEQLKAQQEAQKQYEEQQKKAKEAALKQQEDKAKDALDVAKEGLDKLKETQRENKQADQQATLSTDNSHITGIAAAIGERNQSKDNPLIELAKEQVKNLQAIYNALVKSHEGIPVS